MPDTVLGIVFFSFFAFLLVVAAICIVSPIAIERFRTRNGMADTAWFGGRFYSTPWRTRCTGALLAIVATLGLLHIRS